MCACVGVHVCMHVVYVHVCGRTCVSTCMRVLRGEDWALHCYASHISLICDKSVTTQNLEFLSNWYRKKHLKMHFLTGIVS